MDIKELREKVDQWLALKEEIKEKEAEIKELNERLSPLARALTEAFEAQELTRFDGYKGKVNLVKIDYVSNPATDQDKAAFQNYLKDEGIFDDMVSVHHQKLNSYWKAKLEEAVTQGQELNIPGLEPKQRLEIRKGR